MSLAIHPSAVVDEGARLGEDVEIGPFCHVGPQATLGDGVRLHSHVSLAGDTTVGARTVIFPFASIGHPPQDLKYRGEPVRLTIGEDCLIREGVTMNPGTAGGGSETLVGPRSVFLANAHVAHDCRIGEGVILSNNVMLAGHCQIGDFAILSGGAAAHQFVRIGAHAFVGGLAGVEHDLIPFGLALGNRAALAGLTPAPCPAPTTPSGMPPTAPGTSPQRASRRSWRRCARSPRPPWPRSCANAA